MSIRLSAHKSQTKFEVFLVTMAAIVLATAAFFVCFAFIFFVFLWWAASVVPWVDAVTTSRVFRLARYIVSNFVLNVLY